MIDNQRLIIAGGGLAGCLTALALARSRPELPILLVEAGDSFGGNHIWSFFDSDIAKEDRWLVDPLVAHRWDSYDVLFPRRQRTLANGYNSIESARLDAVVRERLDPARFRTGEPIAHVAADHVRLAGGEILYGTVVDARGPADMAGMSLGWQTFVGRHYRLKAPHGLERPIVMDARVEQDDGYRFVYCLPFAPDRLLIEDTYYTLSPDVDRPLLRRRIEEYAAARGWEPDETIGEEMGSLPVPYGGDVEALWDGDLPRIGLAGGFLHPTTGYTLPDAVRVAVLIAGQEQLDPDSLFTLLRNEARRLWAGRGFYRALNRMLFHAADPQRRYAVLEHFYRLDEALVARFYAGRLGMLDKARILSGRPPVPIGRAIGALVK